MAKVRVIKKNDDYSMDYQVGDILEVTGTWYGGINVNSKTGIPLCLDKDEYEEIPENTDFSHEEYERAANYWKEKDAQSKKLDQDALKKAVEEYIQANNTCALATAAGDFVRCTPLEYTYHDDCFWIFSEGGEKFYALEKNKNVCLVIFDKYEGFGKLKGMQVTGLASIVEPFSQEYVQAADSTEGSGKNAASDESHQNKTKEDRICKFRLQERWRRFQTDTYLRLIWEIDLA